MLEETIVYEFKNQKEWDDCALSAQWPEDKQKFLALITPINFSEILGV
jgi:hypothetical protein